MDMNEPYDCEKCGKKAVDVWQENKCLYYFDGEDEDDPGYKEGGQWVQRVICAECGEVLEVNGGQ